MKIERISDDQIRCFLSSEELSARNMSLSDLTYGSEKARRLFREMAVKADAEADFHVDGIPLMIEAVPTKESGLILIMTKVEDPEELDTRFSRFTRSEEELRGDIADVSPDMRHYAEDLHRYVESQASDVSSRLRCYIFTSLDSVRAAVRTALKKERTARSEEASLFKSSSGHYCLLLFCGGMSAEAFDRFCSYLEEYGRRTIVGRVTEDYYREHYELIIDRDALHML